MDFRRMTAESQSPRPALELISLACMAPDQARHNLRTLLASDPNYFGSLSDGSLRAVLHIEEDTTYERLCRVEYHVELEMLRATFEVNKSSGYSTGLRSMGSLEYVRFYVSYDDGAWWIDQGVRVAHVFDTAGPKPLGCAVTQPVRLREAGGGARGGVRVRAILSWNRVPPAEAPCWLPVWGNVLETVIGAEASPREGEEASNSSDTGAMCEADCGGGQGVFGGFRRAWLRGGVNSSPAAPF